MNFVGHMKSIRFRRCTMKPSTQAFAVTTVRPLDAPGGGAMEFGIPDGATAATTVGDVVDAT
jgi:hypothetical protein